MKKNEALDAIEELSDFVSNVLTKSPSAFGMKIDNDMINKFSCALYVAHKVISSSEKESFHVLGEMDGDKEDE